MNVNEKLKFVLGRVENIVGKGENAGFQHFLLFQQYLYYTIFKYYTINPSISQSLFYFPVAMFKPLAIMHNSTLTSKSRLLTPLKKALEKTVGIGQYASYQHFLLFQQCF